MFSYMILLYSLTGKKESELCNIPYMSKHPLIQCREIYRSHPFTNNTLRKDVPTSHQRVQSLTIQSLTENRMHFKLI